MAASMMCAKCGDKMPCDCKVPKPVPMGTPMAPPKAMTKPMAPLPVATAPPMAKPAFNRASNLGAYHHPPKAAVESSTADMKADKAGMKRTGLSKSAWESSTADKKADANIAKKMMKKSTAW